MNIIFTRRGRWYDITVHSIEELQRAAAVAQIQLNSIPLQFILGESRFIYPFGIDASKTKRLLAHLGT